MQEVIGKYQALHSWQPRESLEALVKKISVLTHKERLCGDTEKLQCAPDPGWGHKMKTDTELSWDHLELTAEFCRLEMKSLKRRFSA